MKEGNISRPERTRWWLRAVAAGVALVTVAAAGGHWWRESRRWVSTDNAYLDGPVHALAARIPGTVEAVLVEENAWVTAGQALVRLDARDVETRRTRAEAAVAEAVASLNAAAAGKTRAVATARLDVVALEKARLDLERVEGLSSGPMVAVARQELEHARAARDGAAAAIDASEAAIAAAGAEIAVATAKLASARAALEEANLQCSYTVITAPVDGRIGRRNVEAGQPVIPAQPLLALVGGGLWLTANFKETQLAGMNPGQAAKVRFDAYPGREFEGTVESLSPASGARFALLPPDNATGNFTRVVQRVPVRIRLHDATLPAGGPGLVPGLSAKVKVLTGTKMEN